MRVQLKCGEGTCWNQAVIAAHAETITALEAEHIETGGANAVVVGTIACDDIRTYMVYNTGYCTARVIPSLGPRPGFARRPDILGPDGDSTVIPGFIENDPVGPQPFEW
ncbi:MAG TPA: hypothetical protein VLF40_00590 [Candidatus Saccharimonadales bacterium]|nr:hypothetical protein [Candidatus Saccharimonadales bacterium]